MRKVAPYKTLAGALRALDNGGRFYNIFTAAEDRVVSAAELKKVAGVFSDMHAAVVFFELAIAELDPRDQKDVIDAFGPAAAAAFRKHHAKRLSPAQFAVGATPGKGYIVEGRARKVDDLTKTSVILMPMTIGKMTTMMPMPISEVFSVYELDAPASASGGRCLVLTPKKTRLSRKSHRFAGLAKVNEIGEGRDKRKQPCLEPLYYSELD